MTDSSSSLTQASSTGAIDSRRLQVFLAAAQTLSFAAAAERLNLTPSAVSHAIKALEEEFDCNLFKRHGPRVTLTRAGLRLMPLAEELLGRMARLRKEVAVIQGNPRSLRVMMPEPFCAYMLPKVLPDFMECFPTAWFEVMPGDCEDEKALAALLSGELDLLLCHTPRSSGDVVRRDLVQDVLGFYVAPFHTLARRSQVDAGVLEIHPLLVSDAVSARMVLERLLGGSRSKSRLWQLPGTESVRELARVGQGIALLPEAMAARPVARGHLVPLSMAGPRLQRTCSVHWWSQTELTWAAEVFIHLISMVSGEHEEELPE